MSVLYTPARGWVTRASWVRCARTGIGSRAGFGIEVTVFAALAVFLLGAGLTALGLVTPTMYDVGIMVMLISAIGFAVRTVDWLRWLRD